MGKIQAKLIIRLVPLISDLGRFLWAFTLKSTIKSFKRPHGIHDSTEILFARNLP